MANPQLILKQFQGELLLKFQKAISPFLDGSGLDESLNSQRERILRYCQFTDQQLEEFVEKHSPPKKKRGRPRKSEDKNLDRNEQPKPVEAVSGNKESLPRKVDNDTSKEETLKPDEKQPKSVEVPPKKKRGRPKKITNDSPKDETHKPDEVTLQPVEEPKNKPGSPKKVANDSPCLNNPVPKERRPRKEKESVNFEEWADRMSNGKLEITRLYNNESKKFWEILMDLENKRVLIHYGKVKYFRDGSPDTKSKLIISEQLLNGDHKTIIQKSFSTELDTRTFNTKEQDSKIKKGYTWIYTNCKC